MSYFKHIGTDSDICISTRIRLARNITGYPFPSRLDNDTASKIFDKVSDVVKNSSIGKDFEYIQAEKLPVVELSALMEQHLISPEFVHSKLHRGIILSTDRAVSIMVNEEDHMRIQIIGEGLCLDKCMDTAQNIDNLFDASIPYAFDENLGFLQSCPTNLGTGMRASVMLHLPALTATGVMQNISSAAGKLGLAVRGFYGEGSSALGFIYQISNQLTLGFTEKEILDRLNDAVQKIISQEKQTRQSILQRDQLLMQDKILRSFGILTNAKMISTDEAMTRLSDLRLGTALKIIDIDIDKIDDLFIKIQPANLVNSENSDVRSRDISRAEMLRTALNTGGQPHV